MNNDSNLNAYGREEVSIPIELCRDNAKLPQYSHDGDAGLDVYAAEEVTIGAMQTALVPTGLKMAIPYGFEIQVRPRSGLSLKTALRIPNAPGTIDAGYRDEICIIVQNLSQESPYTVSCDDRIAQLVLQRVPKAIFHTVEDVSNIGNDRGGGFGSSGGFKQV